jgi:hypothetical protein
VDNISDEHLLEAYMGGLKEDIKHEIFLKHPENIMEAMQFSHHIQAKNRATHKSTTGTYAGSRDRFGAHRETLPQPTEYHRRKWRKEEKKDYALVVIENGQKGINVKKQNCSLWKIMMRRKWRHLHKWVRKNL